MVNEELAKRLLPGFSALHFFIRHHKAERAVRCVVDCKADGISIGKLVHPEVKDFTLLWLIAEIIRIEGGCRSEKAKDVIVWRRSKNEDPKTTRKRFRDVSIGRLKSFDWVTTQEDPKNRRYNLVELTDRGTRYLKKLKKERVTVLEEILGFLEKPIDRDEELVARFDEIAKSAWKAIFLQADELARTIPKD